MQPGGSLDRLEPEGVAEKLGAISWTGVGIFSRIFKSIRQTFAVTNVEWGVAEKRRGGVLVFDAENYQKRNEKQDKTKRGVLLP